jgi:hypothetical protein
VGEVQRERSKGLGERCGGWERWRRLWPTYISVAHIIRSLCQRGRNYSTYSCVHANHDTMMRDWNFCSKYPYKKKQRRPPPGKNKE